MICFLAICMLFQLVNVLCIVDNAINTSIDGDKDWLKSESKYFSLEDNFDSLEMGKRNENKQAEIDEELQNIIQKDIAFIQNYLNEVTTSEYMSTETSTIDIEDILNEVCFYKYQPVETLTTDSQSILNQAEIDENRPAKTAAEDIRGINQDLDVFNNYYNYHFAETEDAQRILNDYRKNLPAVRFGADGSLVDYSRNQPAETAVLKIRTMDLDEDEFNKYVPADTGEFDLDKFLDDHDKDLSLVETVTFVWNNDNEHYSPVRTARWSWAIIGCIVTIILFPIIYLMYLHCKSQKSSKLRVFVIKTKSGKNEPLIGV